eukprot:gene12024-8586_t
MADNSSPRDTEVASSLHPENDRLKNVPIGEGDVEAGSEAGPNAVSASAESSPPAQQSQQSAASAASSQEAVVPSASSSLASHTNATKHDALMQKLQTFLRKMPRKPYALHQPLSRLAVIERKLKRGKPSTPI